MNDDWFTLAELTERLGALVWVEEKMFEILGEWSAFEPVAKAAIVFATASRHHGWHAEIIADCLPTSPQLREREVIQPPTQGWADAIATLRSLAAPDATSTRLRSLVKVLNPWLARESASILDVARPVNDASVQRWLRFVEIDHYDDARAAAELLAAVGADTVQLRDHVTITSLDLTRQ